VPRRALGWALAAYGALGLALVVAGLPIGFDLAGRIERLAASADATLSAAGNSAAAASVALEGLETGLTRSEASSEDAAALAREAALTLAALGSAMEISIFGAQPLLPLAADFRDTSAQANALATELDGITSALATSRGDLDEVSLQLSALAIEIEELRGLTSERTAGVPPVRPFVILLLAWLAIPAIGSLALGIAIVAGWSVRLA
jgi:hypothetical protein